MSVQQSNNNFTPAQVEPATRVRLLISKVAIGPLIGQGGTVIKDIQTRTNTFIRIDSGPENGVLGNLLNSLVPERIVTITSPEASNIAAAVKLIAPILLQARIEARPDLKTDPNVFRVRFLIHSPSIAEFIGGEGKNITKIRDETKAQISVRSADILPYSSERLVLVSGSLDEIATATEAIVPYLSNVTGDSFKSYRPYVPCVRVNPEEQRVKTTLGVKSAQVGAIIGAKGQTIQKIRRFTSCLIQVEPPQDGSDQEIVSVVVSGPETNVAIATKLIRAALKNSQSRAAAAASQGVKA